MFRISLSITLLIAFFLISAQTAVNEPHANQTIFATNSIKAPYVSSIKAHGNFRIEVTNRTTNWTWNIKPQADAAIDALVAKYNQTDRLTNEFSYLLQYYRDSAFSCVVYVLIQNFNYTQVQLFEIVIKDGATSMANFKDYILYSGKRFQNRGRQGRYLTTLRHQQLSHTDSDNKFILSKIQQVSIPFTNVSTRYWQLSNGRIYENALTQSSGRCVYATILKIGTNQRDAKFIFIGSLNMSKYVTTNTSDTSGINNLENIALIRLLVPSLNHLYQFTYSVAQIMERIVTYELDKDKLNSAAYRAVVTLNMSGVASYSNFKTANVSNITVFMIVEDKNTTRYIKSATFSNTNPNKIINFNMTFFNETKNRQNQNTSYFYGNIGDSKLLHDREKAELKNYLNKSVLVQVEQQDSVTGNLKYLQFTIYPGVKHYSLYAYNKTGYFYLSIIANISDINSLKVSNKLNPNTWKLIGLHCLVGSYIYNFKSLQISNYVTRRPYQRFYLQQYYQSSASDSIFDFTTTQWQYLSLSYFEIAFLFQTNKDTALFPLFGRIFLRDTGNNNVVQLNDVRIGAANAKKGSNNIYSPTNISQFVKTQILQQATKRNVWKTINGSETYQEFDKYIKTFFSIPIPNNPTTSYYMIVENTIFGTYFLVGQSRKMENCKIKEFVPIIKMNNNSPQNNNNKTDKQDEKGQQKKKEHCNETKSDKNGQKDSTPTTINNNTENPAKSVEPVKPVDSGNKPNPGNPTNANPPETVIITPEPTKSDNTSSKTNQYVPCPHHDDNFVRSNSYLQSINIPTFVNLTKLDLIKDTTFLKLIEPNQQYYQSITLNYTFIYAQRGTFHNKTEFYRLFFSNDSSSSSPTHLFFIISTQKSNYSFNIISVTESGILNENVLEQQISLILLNQHLSDLLAYRYLGITLHSASQYSLVLAVKIVSYKYRMYTARFHIQPLTQKLEKTSIYYWDEDKL